MTKLFSNSYKLFIGGEWIAAEEERTFDTFCPANGELLAKCAEASEKDVAKAVTAAWQAFGTWKKTTAVERSDILFKIADVIDQNKEKLALIESYNNGKPIRETRNIDVPLSADHFRYFASAIRTQEGNATMIDNDMLSIILQEPLGVVGQIIPWNFPLLMAAWKLAPALAAGDCVVIKPSSQTPLSILEFAKLIQPLLPPGVINVITGGGSRTGNFLLNHPGISKLAFTGSTEIGYEVAAAAAEKLIPATLELGGKSANIFFDDMPWEKAVDGACLGILFNQGQVCCAGSRIFVQENVYEKFLAAVKERFEKVKVGLPWDEDTMMGSQISESQLEKILSCVELGKQEGARVITGGARITTSGLEKGAFLQPTILADVKNSMRVAQEEIFGPVVCFLKFRNEEDVIQMANESIYGLGGAVWTKDIGRAFRVAQAIETGRMWVNTYNQIPANSPFGGYKKSGIGRETHKMMLQNYTQTKSILISLSDLPSGFY